ncbi:protein of unknown function [Stenotrophomonas maltophilia]|nr:protein of unknown function [Stenotrophomonas maltophilia]
MPRSLLLLERLGRVLRDGGQRFLVSLAGRGTGLAVRLNIPTGCFFCYGGVFSSGYCVFQCGFSIIFVVLVSLKLLGEIIVAITSMGLTGSGIILLALTLK